MAHLLVEYSTPWYNVPTSWAGVLVATGNVRWATKREQSINKRPKGKTSKWRGVYFNKHHGKYMVRANEIYVGVFESEIDAAAAYNRCVLKNNLRNKLNFIVEVV